MQTLARIWHPVSEQVFRRYEKRHDAFGGGQQLTQVFIRKKFYR